MAVLGERFGARVDEVAAAQSLLANSEDKFTALQDVAWALMNAKEFLFRR